MQNNTERNLALDFTKGTLVLTMVLYHWLNYFCHSVWDIYKYLRFLTPSFICITGFLISNVYIAKYGVSDPRLPFRLFQRALKILGIFIALNLIRGLTLPESSRSQLLALHSSFKGIVDVYVIGNGGSGGQEKAVAFFILVPISYLLMISALLLVVCRWYRSIFYVAGACALAVSGVLELRGIQANNLGLLAIGLLGVILGYAPLENVNGVVRYVGYIAAAYGCYLAAITVWNVVYFLQVVGVILSLMIIYCLGSIGSHLGTVRRHIVVLGKYSLVGYIAQIAVLQLMHRGLRQVEVGRAVLAISFIMAFVLTMLIVEATDWARRSAVGVDRFYRVIFN